MAYDITNSWSKVHKCNILSLLLSCTSAASKLLVQLSLNLCIRKINYMVTYWRSAGTLDSIRDRRDDAPGTCLGCARERLLPAGSLPVGCSWEGKKGTGRGRETVTR